MSSSQFFISYPDAHFCFESGKNGKECGIFHKHKSEKCLIEYRRFLNKLLVSQHYMSDSKIERIIRKYPDLIRCVHNQKESLCMLAIESMNPHIFSYIKKRYQTPYLCKVAYYNYGYPLECFSNEDSIYDIISENH